MAKLEIGKKPRHQFVSFPQEAAQLSLNTVSSVASELWADPDSATTSIFHSRMQHWADLNLTQVRPQSTGSFFKTRARQKLVPTYTQGVN
jgi:hypothetical protein